MENNGEKLRMSEIPCPKDRWTINQKKCTTCCECLDACPLGLLYLEESQKVVLIKNSGATCTQCGDCASACAYEAIVLT